MENQGCGTAAEHGVQGTKRCFDDNQAPQGWSGTTSQASIEQETTINFLQIMKPTTLAKLPLSSRPRQRK
jgi:hypothetical protein